MERPLTVLSVVGTRPEVIKMAPVVHAFERRSDRVRFVLCSTGQHRELLDQALGVFALEPDFDLDLMEPDQRLPHLTARLLEGLDSVVARARPDWILAQGDTTTVLASAFVAFYNGVRFGHVEAGLRTGDLQAPYPEEMNRKVADVVADLFFAPTSRAQAALLAEGHAADRIYVTGNTVVDALLEIGGQEYDWQAGPLAAVGDEALTILVTAHRRESFGEPMRALCVALAQLAGRVPEACLVFPVHLNPHVREPVTELLRDVPNVHLLDPLDYRSLVHLMQRSALILTDSGGIQEEAPTFGVPLLVLREKTERPEAVEAGFARVVGTDPETIVCEALALLGDSELRARLASTPNPFGDGQAAERIADAVLAFPVG
jgi:UDP-N-acetylglucosamine 2-epimerase